MSWQHLVPSSTPVCSAPWLCHLRMHDWIDMGTLLGMGRRGVSRRRGCRGCGRIELWRCGWATSSPGWGHWGYVPLPKIRYGWDAVEEDRLAQQQLMTAEEIARGVSG